MGLNLANYFCCMPHLEAMASLGAIFFCFLIWLVGHVVPGRGWIEAEVHGLEDTQKILLMALATRLQITVRKHYLPQKGKLVDTA